MKLAFGEIFCVMRDYSAFFRSRVIEDVMAAGGMIEYKTISFQKSDYFLWSKLRQLRHGRKK